MQYKWIILFYILIVIFLYVKRKSIVTQAKIIFLYRTRFGLRFIEKYGQKYKQWIRLIGYVGIGAAYIGIIFIAYVMLKSLYDLFFIPEAPAGVSLVLPGVNVPGIGVLSFWYWLIAIFIIAIVHEFGHGLVAKAHDIHVKSTGLVFIGPIIGAFVEPDEKDLAKRQDTTQYSTFAAGPFANVLLALLAVVLLSLVLFPAQTKITEPAGFTFEEYVNDASPAKTAGLMPETVITGINNKMVADYQSFGRLFQRLDPNTEVIIQTKEKDFRITTATHPDDPEQPFLGISKIRNERQLKQEYQTWAVKKLYAALLWFIDLFRWLFLLSLGIGLFNLLPLPIVDGGRIMQTTLHNLSGKERGERLFRRISFFFVLLLLFNLIFPYFRSLF